MSWFGRLRNSLATRRSDRNLDEEIRFHLDQRVEENVENGMSIEEARREARRRFGSPLRARDLTRDVDTIDWIETTWRDFLDAFRMLRRNPGYALAAVLALALGIGANTAMFSLVNAVLLRSLPYQNPDRLVLLWGNVLREHGLERRGASVPDFLDWRNQSRSFEGMAAWWGTTLMLSGEDQIERIDAEVVTPGYLTLLGVQPTLGRGFHRDEGVGFSSPPVVILSHGLWSRRFGSDPSVIGRPVRINQRPCTVIGVLPAGFRGLSDQADLWIPPGNIQMMEALAQRRSTRWFSVLARLAPGVTIAQAQADMDSVCRGLEREFPDSNEKRGVEVAALRTETVGELRPALLVIMAAVGFVLLIACTNVGNLLLARFESRSHEIAIRTAIGASRARLIRRLLSESILLALIGALLGLALALIAVRVLIRQSPIEFPSFVHPGIDLRVFLFTLGISLVAGILVGLAPAVHFSSAQIHSLLKGAPSRTGGSRGSRRFREALVVAQVALVLILLVGAGLLIRSFLQLTTLDPGFNPAHLLTARINLPVIDPGGSEGADGGAGPGAGGSATPREEREIPALDAIVERVRSLPGVRAVGLASDIPLSGDASAVFYTPEGAAPSSAETAPRAYIHRVSPGFFDALEIPLLRGRDFLPSDVDVVGISRKVADTYWPGEDPIGKRIKPGRRESRAPSFRVIGVVGEVKYRGLPNNPTGDPDLYLPFDSDTGGFALLARTEADPAALIPVLRSEFRAMSRSLILDDLTPMAARVAAQTSGARFTGWLMGIFSSVALLLAIIGIYGVVSYSVVRRTREFGIRMALGARFGDIVREVLGRGMILVGVGLGAGLIGAFALTRGLASLLYGVRPDDPVTYAAVTLLLFLVALAAIFFPARRAAKAHPVAALRIE